MVCLQLSLLLHKKEQLKERIYLAIICIYFTQVTVHIWTVEVQVHKNSLNSKNYAELLHGSSMFRVHYTQSPLQSIFVGMFRLTYLSSQLNRILSMNRPFRMNGMCVKWIQTMEHGHGPTEQCPLGSWIKYDTKWKKIDTPLSAHILIA